MRKLLSMIFRYLLNISSQRHFASIDVQMDFTWKCICWKRIKIQVRKVMWKNKTNSIDSMYWHFSALLGIKQIKVLPMTNVTRLGNFWNFLATNFFYKSSPNVWWLFGHLWKPLLCESNFLGFFSGQLLQNLGYFLFQHLVTLPMTSTIAKHFHATNKLGW